MDILSRLSFPENHLFVNKHKQIIFFICLSPVFDSQPLGAEHTEAFRCCSAKYFLCHLKNDSKNNNQKVPLVCLFCQNQQVKVLFFYSMIGQFYSFPNPKYYSSFLWSWWRAIEKPIHYHYQLVTAQSRAPLLSFQCTGYPTYCHFPTYREMLCGCILPHILLLW